MPRKKTLDQFIEEARQVHKDKYDYSKAIYKDTHTKLCIICPKHGEFMQEPNNHLHGYGCVKCMAEAAAARLRSTTEEFVKKATKVHGDRYDYSKVEYKNSDTKVRIICHEHGEFMQTPDNHLHGAGCPKCANMYSPNNEEFIAKIKEIHGDKYDYSLVEYKGNKNKVILICPEHGPFSISPQSILRRKQGCAKCSGNWGIDKDYFIKIATERFKGKYDYSEVVWQGYRTKVAIRCPEHGVFLQTPLIHLKTSGCPKCAGKKLDQDLFIQKAQQIHGDKYDYSKVDYHDSKSKVCIVCPKHGEFWIKPNDHLCGHGCRKCYDEETKARLTKPFDDFLELANKIHDGKYDYSKAEYVNRSVPIRIICPVHGEFMQPPNSHLKSLGCPLCNNSSLETHVAKLLKYHGIRFIPEKTFDWLTCDGTLHLDFYLPEHHIAIECQGLQHFKAVDFFGGKEGLKQTKYRDRVKKEKCEDKHIRMLYYSNLGIKYPYPVIESDEVLLEEISKGNEAGDYIEIDLPVLPLVFD